MNTIANGLLFFFFKLSLEMFYESIFIWINISNYQLFLYFGNEKIGNLKIIKLSILIEIKKHRIFLDLCLLKRC